jgi:hypothetical protein
VLWHYSFFFSNTQTLGESMGQEAASIDNVEQNNYYEFFIFDD